MPALGQLCIHSFAFPPRNWALCHGQLLPINQNQALFSLLGTTYGGNGQTTFALPDLRDKGVVAAGQGNVAYRGLPPLATWAIALQGTFGAVMNPFVGEILVLPNYPPGYQGLLRCEGQLLPISQNTALFALLGTYYGGDGKTTFALPDMRGDDGGAGYHKNFEGAIHHYYIATQGVFPPRG